MRYVDRCKSGVIALFVLGSVLVPAAKADLLYDVRSVTFQTSTPYEYSFTEPTFLTATTTIPAAAVTLITVPDNCTLVSVTITNPSSASPEFGDTWTGCSNSGDSGFSFTTLNGGPLTHDGTFSNGAPLATVLTISGTPTSAVPEPNSVGLLLTAIAAAGVFARKQVKENSVFKP